MKAVIIKHKIILLSFLIPFIYLLPVLNSPLSSDDISNFNLRVSQEDYYAKSIFEIAESDITLFKNAGRFTPLSFYLEEAVFKYFQTINQYKTFLYCINLFSIFTFALLLYLLELKRIIPLFFICYGGQVQFRLQYHDSFTGFNGMYIILSICIFLSTSFYILYLKESKVYLLFVSLFLAIASILLSETGLFVIPFLTCSALFANVSKKKVIVSLAPFFVSALTYVVYVLAIRAHVKVFYPGVETNFVVSPMMDVLWKQLFAALPFSNLYHHTAIPKIMWAELSSISHLIIVFCLFFLFLFIFMETKKGIESNKVSWYLPALLLGLVLMVVPVVFIMPSIKYQQTLLYGFGYLPVYLQNYGTALLISLLMRLVISKKNNFIMVTLSYSLFLTIYISSASAFLFNRGISKVLAYEQSLRAQAIFASVEHGILSCCPEGSVIIVINNAIWRDPEVSQKIFQNITGKKFSVYDYGNWKASEIKPEEQSCYILDCQNGDTIFTKLYSADCSSETMLNLLAEDSFVHDIRLCEVERPLLTHFTKTP